MTPVDFYCTCGYFIKPVDILPNELTTLCLMLSGKID